MLSIAKSDEATHTVRPPIQGQGLYTGDRVPGNVTNGVKILKKVYGLLQIYRQRHEGKYPDSPIGALNDVYANPTAYELKDLAGAAALLVNPDNIYDDDSSTRRRSPRAHTTIITDRRPDGTFTGSSRPVATRDLLAYTKTYFHPNNPHYGEKRRQLNPVGFYLVLWDDGSIERIPYDEAIFVLTGLGESAMMQRAFPGQAGVPFNSVTYAEYEMKNGRRKLPPIGFPVPDLESEVIPDNGGYESLLWLSRLLNAPLEREQIWDALGRTEKEFTLNSVQAGAQKLGLNLIGQKLTLAELKKRNAPALLYLQDDARLITLSTLDDKYALIVDRGLTRMVDRSTLAKHYSGEALLFGEVSTQAALRVEDPLREIEVQDPSAEITQSITLSNRGQQDLTLQIEYPIPGVTSTELQSATLAPGARTQLHLKLKWRSVLPGREQTDLITIKTNDPIAPRVQLAFRLRLADGVSTPFYTSDASSLPRAEDDPNNVIAMAAPTVKVGQAAPDFTTTDMNGKAWKLSDLKGKENLLLTFFPKCFTGGCANHLSSLRDHQAEFDAADTQILAVSVDPAEGERGQKAFAAQWKFLFPLIPDTQRKLSMLYGAAQNDNQLAARMSVLIDKAGIVRWIDTDVHVSTHGADALARMRELGMTK
jgi:peroxiredoxin Q/BCP